MAPPPLPSRAAPPPLPTGRMGGTVTSDRDVQRASGRTTGVWVQVSSTNVEMMKVEPEYNLDGELTGVGTITIQFLNGAQYEYPDRPMADWYDLVESSSKGRKTYWDVRGPGRSRKGMGIWPFRQIRSATRTPAQVAALAGRRQPQTAAQRARRFTRGGKRNAFGAGGLGVG
jgi:hypothetical protein